MTLNVGEKLMMNLNEKRVLSGHSNLSKNMLRNLSCFKKTLAVSKLIWGK